jgi:hypothetical protein
MKIVQKTDWATFWATFQQNHLVTLPENFNHIFSANCVKENGRYYQGHANVTQVPIL